MTQAYKSQPPNSQEAESEGLSQVQEQLGLHRETLS